MSKKQPKADGKRGITLQTPVFLPSITTELYAQLTGQTVDTVRGQMRLGHLPSIKVGRYRHINLVALTRLCEDQAAAILKSVDSVTAR